MAEHNWDATHRLASGYYRWTCTACERTCEGDIPPGPFDTPPVPGECPGSPVPDPRPPAERPRGLCPGCGPVEISDDGLCWACNGVLVEAEILAYVLADEQKRTVEACAALIERPRCRTWSPEEAAAQIRQHLKDGRLL